MCLINALISCSFVTKTRRRITDDYVTYIDAHVSLDIDEIIKSFWFPEFQNFEHRGAKINKMLEMYDYKLGTDRQLLDNFMQSFANQVTDNRTTSTFGTSYKGSSSFKSKKYPKFSSNAWERVALARWSESKSCDKSQDTNDSGPVCHYWNKQLPILGDFLRPTDLAVQASQLKMHF